MVCRQKVPVVCDDPYCLSAMYFGSISSPPEMISLLLAVLMQVRGDHNAGDWTALCTHLYPNTTGIAYGMLSWRKTGHFQKHCDSVSGSVYVCVFPFIYPYVFLSTHL